MTDEFRDCYVGEKGYDALKKLMKSGNDFCIDVAKCLQERSDAEVNYVKALRKTSDALQKLAGRAKGTLALAFITLATQTGKEGDAHSLIAGTLLNDISIPMKNLAEAQAKERKSIEDTMNGKFKEWNFQKETDNKYRLRQIDKCRDIEMLTNKISEVANSSRSSKSKGSSVSAPLVMSCVMPASRHTSASDKSTCHSDGKHHCHLEASIKKAEEELEKIERKYQTSTKDVELLRQACDAEMQRSCDQLQKMELDRVTEIDSYIKTYSSSFQTLTGTMNQITQDLYSIQISPMNDIIVQARWNVEPTEIEILLYDIYAENEKNVMSEQRRILSLMNWIAILKKNVEIQTQSKNESSSSLSSGSRPQKSIEDDSPDDDGAMCSTSSLPQKDIVRKAVHHRDRSSSSSNDDDGGMYRSKRDKKKKEGIDGFSSEIFIDRRGAALLEQLYRASLYKIESVYNSIKGIREPTYEHAQRLTRTYTEKGCPTTFLRLPTQSLTQAPPSAPSTMKYFAQAMPMFAAAPIVQQQQAPVAYSTQRQAPPIGWPMDEPRLARAAPVANHLPQYRVLPLNGASYNRPVPAMAMPMARAPDKHVRALYSYEAKHKDELNLEPGDIIILLERRPDDWFKGQLEGRIGLFPGNYVEEI